MPRKRRGGNLSQVSRNAKRLREQRKRDREAAAEKEQTPGQGEPVVVSSDSQQPGPSTVVCSSGCAGQNLSRNERHAIWKAAKPFMARAKMFQARRNREFIAVARQHDFVTFEEADYIEMSSLDLGTVNDVTCEHCQALRFQKEKSKICCQGGKVNLDPLPMPPDEIVKYYGTDRKSRKFKERIREYNSVHGMASLGLEHHILGSPDSNPFQGNLRIQGQMYHDVGSVQALPGHKPAYAQIYFHDTDYQTKTRIDGYTGDRKLDEEIVHDLTCALNDINPYVNVFRAAGELIQASDDSDKAHIILVNDKTKIPEGAHQRSYNSPVASEVAAIVFGEPEQVQRERPVILRYKNTGRLQSISIKHRSYDPLLYVLLFPHGTDGWSHHFKKETGITMLDFYRYRLNIREGEFLMKSGRLTQQYAVDQWNKIEKDRIDWQRNNQKQLRAEKYVGFIDAQDNDDLANAGKKVILAPTMYYSPRWYKELMQDAMTIVREYGKPDFFITMTTNPKWPEITNSLLAGETASDRPDLCVRVFELYFQELMDDLSKKHVLGKVVAYCVTIEFQKRGLPHAHILLIVRDEDKPRTAEDVDKVVWAEIPDEQVNPKLHDVIVNNNMHGPCGSINPKCPCMEKKKCTKSYPMPLKPNTIAREDSVPVYRRRAKEDGGNTYKKWVNGQEYEMDNSWVVPYNAALSLKYRCHLNVEVVRSTHSVKYLYKYIYKGPDKVLVKRSNDEISDYLSARYLSSSESLWKIYGFPMQQRSPAVRKLPCHLNEEQHVVFDPDQVPNVEAARKTMLTEFFELNRTDSEAQALKMTYTDVVKYYTWTKHKIWKRREKGRITRANEFESDMIGRIPIIAFNIHQKERFFLRMLLLTVHSPKSFDDLKTVDGDLCPTYESACAKMGLIQNDDEVYNTMDEVVDRNFGGPLIHMFTTILLLCKPQKPEDFYQRYKVELCRHLMKKDRVSEPTEAHVNSVLKLIKKRVSQEGLTMNQVGLPEPHLSDDEARIPQLLQEELFDQDQRSELEEQAADQEQTLNDDQLEVYGIVLDSVFKNLGRAFCLNAAGGTGKTYLINLILSKVRSAGGVALATAYSGIASKLLHNGRTLHSRLGVPIEIKENSTCEIRKSSPKGQLMQKAKLLVIDEVTMGHRYVFEAIDRSLRDVRDAPNKLFGGMTVLFCGDWRQILPVIPRGSRAEVVSATLKHSQIWKFVSECTLRKNMRVRLGPIAEGFAEWLLLLGEGKINSVEGAGPSAIQIPAALLLKGKSLMDLCNHVYDGLERSASDKEWFSSRMIITGKNVEVDKINEMMLNMVPGTVRDYYSYDESVEDGTMHPLEYIHKLMPNGFPAHHLRLKKGVPIMLLRNIDPANGHCNGSRYVITNLLNNTIEARLLSGGNAGEKILIPRIPHSTTESYPFNFTRRQFPIRLAFAITANKSQGQTLEKVRFQFHY